MIEALFLLAPLLVVPFSLKAVDGAHPPLLPWCAAAAAASFLLPPGPAAGAVATAWLAFTLVVAAEGLTRHLRCGRSDASGLAIAAGRACLAVGGAWLVLSRLGATPMGFEEPIVLLTAVHFHYAGFATLSLAGLVGRALGSPPASYAWIAGLLIAGPPLLALGITTSRPLELAGAVVQAAGLGGLSALMIVLVRRGRLGRGPAVLLAISAAAVWIGLILALVYAWGQATGQPTISIPVMARIHGTVNALGFVGCGLGAFAFTSAGSAAGAARPPSDSPRARGTPASS